MSVETTIDFLSAALRAMRLESGRSGLVTLVSFSVLTSVPRSV